MGIDDADTAIQGARWKYAFQGYILGKTSKYEACELANPSRSKIRDLTVSFQQLSSILQASEDLLHAKNFKKLLRVSSSND